MIAPIIGIPAVNTAMGTGGSSDVSLYPLFICLAVFIALFIAFAGSHPVQRIELLTWFFIIIVPVVAVALSQGY